MRAQIHSGVRDLAQQHSEVMLGFCQASVSCSDLFIGAHFKKHATGQLSAQQRVLSPQGAFWQTSV